MSTYMLAALSLNNQDKIVHMLLKTPSLSVKEVCAKLSEDKKISIQSTHDLVRKLLAQEVLTKNGHQLFVSQEWVLKLQKILPSQMGFELTEGESLRWVFGDLMHLDAFWKHAALSILKGNPYVPVFMSTPHEMWAYAPQREKSQMDFFDYFRNNERHAYYAISGETSEDQKARADLHHEYIHTEKTIVNSERYSHIVVIGDMVSITKLGKKDEGSIDEIYKKYGGQPLFQEKMINFLESVGRTSFSLEHNKEKAKILRKKIAKDMYVPREIIEEFELW